MGVFRVPIKLENVVDAELVSRGILSESRRYESTAIVDSGAVMLALPQDVVDRLGLTKIRTTIVRYADERKEERDVVGTVLLEIAGRRMPSDAIVLPPTADILIGQVQLETLDLLIDCPNKTLIPRPESPIHPLLNLK